MLGGRSSLCTLNEGVISVMLDCVGKDDCDENITYLSLYSSGEATMVLEVHNVWFSVRPTLHRDDIIGSAKLNERKQAGHKLKNYLPTQESSNKLLKKKVTTTAGYIPRQ